MPRSRGERGRRSTLPRSRGERDRASLGSLLCWLLRGDSRRSDGSGRLRAAFSAESEASHLDEALEEREELADEENATLGSDCRAPGEEVQLSLRLTK